VPECNPLSAGREHPRAQALVQVLYSLPGHGLEQPEIGLRTHDGNRIEQAAGLVTQAGRPSEDSVPDRLRNAPLAGEHLCY
jgi:hypothetical protein